MVPLVRGLWISTIALVVMLSMVPLQTSSTEQEDNPPLPDWTVLVYMAGDNDLEDAAIDDFNELESVGSTEQVNILVQIDRNSGEDKTNGDWNDTRRYKIEKDSDKDTITSPILDDTLGELDMSDPETLRDFLLWGVENYPSQRNLVILWDHGLGWKGGICNDEGGGSRHYMPISDVRKALTQVREQWNHTFDILGFDACLMGGVEVYYQLEGYVNYSFGSGKNEPTDGLPYNEFVRDLVKNPAMSEEELLEMITSYYVRSYRDLSPISVHDAGIDLRRFPELSEKVDEFVEELLDQLSYYRQEVYDARNATEEYERSHSYYYLDFMDFVRKARERIRNPRFRAVADDLEVALDDAIVAHHAWSVLNKESDTVRNSTGMTVYFPDPTGGSSKVDDIGKYKALRFAELTHWDEFLEELYRYNDPDYRELKAVHSSMTHDMSMIDEDGDGANDTFILNYNLTTGKGNSLENLTMEVQVLNNTGTMVIHELLTPNGTSGSLFLNVQDHGFDNYSYHLYIWDENHTLQDQAGYQHDFQLYGVEFELTMIDDQGNEIEPEVIKAKPGENLTLNIKVTNTGNSRESFRLSTSGVPLKYIVLFHETPFVLDPGEGKVFPFNISALDRIHSGTDTFYVYVTCLENESVEDGEFLTLRVEEAGNGNGEDEIEKYHQWIIILIFVSAVFVAILLVNWRNEKDKNLRVTLVDPEVEEVLSFTKNLAEGGRELTQRNEGAVRRR